MTPDERARQVAAEEGYPHGRALDGDRGLWVVLLTYGRARLGVGPLDPAFGFTDVW